MLEKMKVIVRKCLYCDIIIPNTVRSQARYCSNKCRMKAHKERSRRCPVCGMNIGSKRKDARYCSSKCRGIHYKTRLH